MEPEEHDPDAGRHAKYAAERPGSHGLFDRDGVPNLAEVQGELKGHRGITWRVIVSLAQDDAERLGFTERQHWEDALRRCMPDVAESMGVRESNLRWAAAYHQAEGHPHCHVLMWEKDPERSRGVVSPGERRDIRKALINVICDEERTKLYLEKGMLRDLLRDQTGQELRGLGLRRYLREASLETEAAHGCPPGLRPLLDDESRAQLQTRLEAIAKEMPGHGRVTLKYMPPDVAEKVRDTSDWLLRQPGFADQARRYQEIARELAGAYVFKPEALAQAGQNAYNDARDRVAQYVLRGAAEIQQTERAAERSTGTNARTAGKVWKGAFRAVEKERQKAEARGKLEKMREARKQERKERQQYQHREERDRL